MRPCGDLGDRVVERVPTRGAGGEHGLRGVVATEEGLAGPGFGSKGVGPDGRRFVRVSRRLRESF